MFFERGVDVDAGLIERVGLEILDLAADRDRKPDPLAARIVPFKRDIYAQVFATFGPRLAPA